MILSTNIRSLRVGLLPKCLSHTIFRNNTKSENMKINFQNPIIMSIFKAVLSSIPKLVMLPIIAKSVVAVLLMMIVILAIRRTSLNNPLPVYRYKQ